MYEGKDIPAPVIGDWVEASEVDTNPNAHPDSARGNYGVAYAQNSRKHYYAL